MPAARKTNEGRVRINRSVVQRARELGIDPGAICTTALQQAIKKMEAAEEVPGSAVTDK